MDLSSSEPKTVFERPAQQVASGMRVGIRGAVFQIGEGEQSAVTLSIAVADGFWQPIEDKGMSATILLSPGEARMVSAGLSEAAAAALDAAPPMYE